MNDNIMSVEKFNEVITLLGDDYIVTELDAREYKDSETGERMIEIKSFKYRER